VAREYARTAGIERLAPHDLRRYAGWEHMPSCSPNGLLRLDFLFHNSA